MPTYRYSCPGCGEFEARAGYDDSKVSCGCGGTAIRAPYSGGISLKASADHIPDPAYRQDKQFRDLRNTWGDGDRAMSMLRKNVRTDGEGNKYLNVAGMNE